MMKNSNPVGPFYIELEAGDWSGDGHDNSEKIFCLSNKPKSEIEKAYAAGVKVIGFDLIDDIAADYQDSCLPNEFKKLLEDAGYEGDFDKDGESYTVWYDDWFDLYLYFVSRGDPELEIKQIKCQNMAIGGYGIYSN